MKKYSPLLIAVPFAIGLLTITGWVFAINFLKYPFTGMPAMNPVTAICFTLYGLSFLIDYKASQNKVLVLFSVGLSAVVVVVGALKLLSAISVHLQDHIYPMSLNSAFNFVLAGSALILVKTKSGWLKGAANYMALIIFIIAMFSFVGFIYHINKLFGINNLLPLTLQTAISFIFLSVAFMYGNSGHAFMAIISTDKTGGKLARAVLPIGIALPVFLGYILVLVLERSGIAVEIGIAALVTGIIVAFIIVLTFVSSSMNTSDEARRRSEELYQKMVLEVQDYSILLLDIHGNIVNWNAGAEKIKGYRAEEIVGKNFRLFYSKEDLENKVPERMLNTAMAEGRSVDEGWRIRKDGKAFWASVTITALHDEAGKVIGLSKVTHDLTQRRNAEIELQQQAALIRMVPDGIITSSKSRTFVDMNEGAEKMFDLVKKEVIGKPVDEFISLVFAPGVDFKEEFAGLWRNGFWRGEFQVKNKKTGKLVNVLASIKTLDNIQGNEPGFVTIYTDIGLLRVNDELKKANSYLEQLAFISAHDIKAPIHTLKGLSELMLKSGSLSAQDSELVKMQYNVVNKMEVTNMALNEILKLRRGLLATDITTGESLPVSAILDNVLMTLKAEIEKAGATIKIELGDVAEVRLPFFYVQSIFHNLIANSIKYRARERALVISVEAKKKGEQMLYFKIADNGMGFDMVRNQTKLFGIFKRFHSQVEGAGVGLHIVKSIVEAYEGEITAQSEENKGTTFEISLKNPNVV